MKYNEQQRKLAIDKAKRGNGYWGVSPKKDVIEYGFRDENDLDEVRHPLSDASFVTETYMIVESRMNFLEDWE